MKAKSIGPSQVTLGIISDWHHVQADGLGVVLCHHGSDSEEAPHFLNYALRSPAGLPAAMVSESSAVNSQYHVLMLRLMPLD